MKRFRIGQSGLEASRISLGCMRIHSLSVDAAAKLVDTALEEGIDFFDHADIYGSGRSEEVFGEVLAQTPSLRDRMLLQSKCGIRKGFFDFSREHILASVDGSLRRLHTDHLDVLLLHRPDTLMEPAEVAEAFSRLERSGKVRHFGVSNQNPMQIELLSRYLGQPILVDQLQLGPTHTGMIDAGLHVNMSDAASTVHDGGVLDYCRLKGITIQPWSPFQHGSIRGVFLGSPDYPELNRTLEALAAEKQVTPSAISVAWLLRHPAGFQPVVGTTDPTHLRDLCKASEIELTRPEWYALYRAAGNTLP